MARHHVIPLVAVLVIWASLLSGPGVEAGHQFEDVPDSSPYHESITWLVNAGITAGCNVAPPLYCPQASVTREQMAVFLRRAAQTYQVIDANGLMVGRTLRFDDHTATVVFTWRGTTRYARVNLNGFMSDGVLYYPDSLTCDGSPFVDQFDLAPISAFVRGGTNFYQLSPTGDIYEQAPGEPRIVPAHMDMSMRRADGPCTIFSSSPARTFYPAVVTGNLAELGFVPPFHLDLAGLTAP